MNQERLPQNTAAINTASSDPSGKTPATLPREDSKQAATSTPKQDAATAAHQHPQGIQPPKAEKNYSQPQGASGKERSSFLMMNVMMLFSFLLAVAAIVLAVVMWMSVEKADRRLDEKLSGVTNTLTDTISSAKTAREMAQQSLDKYNEASGKISYAAAQIEGIGDPTRLVQDLRDEIKTMRTLDGDLYGAIEIAELQSQLVGSVEPILFTLKTIDERLQRQGQSSQSPLRRAIAQDIDTISAIQMPDTLAMTKTVSDLLNASDQWRLIIDAPADKELAPLSIIAHAQDSVVSGIEQENMPQPSEEGVLKRSWNWTSNKASELGQSTWNELTSMIRITPINNPEAVLMSPSQGYALRENVKLRLLNLRLTLLQRQYEAANAEIAQIGHMLQNYYMTTDDNVKAAQLALNQLKTQAHAVQWPQPQATKTALAALGNRN